MAAFTEPGLEQKIWPLDWPPAGMYLHVRKVGIGLSGIGGELVKQVLLVSLVSLAIVLSFVMMFFLFV